MSSTTHTITLTARESGLKQAFDTIKKGATEDAAALKALGRDGSSSLKQMDAAAKTSAQSQEQLRARMAALGAVATTAAGVLADWSRSSQDAAAIQRQLQTAIEATGESYDKYADRVSEVGKRAVQLGQDDEAASQAIAALTQVTGDASAALDQMGLVMDLAAAKHMSLESAAELVGRVMEGNIGLLNRQGFAIDANATATQALAQVQTAVAGQAEASATNYARMREELSNVTDAIGGTVGQFAPLLAMLPGLSVGFSAVGSAIGAIAPSLKEAGLASSALDLAMGPVGIVAAAGAAAIAIYKVADSMSTSFQEDAKGATKAADTFAESLKRLGAAGDPLAVKGQAWAARFEQMTDFDDDFKRLRDRMNEIQDTHVDFSKGNTDEARAQVAALHREYEGLDQAISKSADFQSDLNEILTATGPASDAARASVENYFRLYDAGKISLLGVINNINRINEQLPEQNAKMIEAAAATKGNTIAMQQQVIAAHSMAQAQADVTAQTAEYIRQQREFQSLAVGDSAEEAAAGVGDLGDAFKQSAEFAEQQRIKIQDAQMAMVDYAKAVSGAGSFAAQLRPVDLAPKGGDKVTGTAADLQQTAGVLDSVLGTFKQLDSLGQAADQAGGIAQKLIGDPGEIGEIDRLLNKGRITTEQYNDAVDAGNDIRKESGAIENDLNTIRAKQLPLLAEADQRYGDVIDKISRMGAEEAQATLGFMDANEAMKAQNALALVASASMGDLGEAGKQATTDILQGAVDADPVLGEMLKKMGLISIGADGTITVNFDGGKEVQATLDDVVSSIDQLAIAIDLLDGKPDLEITVKYLADAEQAKAEASIVEGSLTAIDHAVATFKVEGDGTQANDSIQNVADNMANVDGTVANVAVNGDASGAEEAVNDAAAARDGIDGSAAMIFLQGNADSFWATVGGINGSMVGTAYINVVATGSGAGYGLGLQQALGGMVPPTAAGGRLVGDLQRVRVNEGGPEMVTLPTGDDVWLPSGSMVTPSAASKMGRGRGESGRSFVNYGSITIQANNPAEFHSWYQSYATVGR